MNEADQRRQLLLRGTAQAKLFCDKNSLPVPPVNIAEKDAWAFSACAYYRPVRIEICVEACATIGTAGRAWSYPGYSTDRTPYGVIAHEIGHHADHQRSKKRGAYFGDYSVGICTVASEAPITSYCPNNAEWFAEMFRLFITNPDLLEKLRPRTYQLIEADFRPVVTDAWDVVLRDAPARTLDVARRKVDEAMKSTARRQARRLL